MRVQSERPMRKRRQPRLPDLATPCLIAVYLVAVTDLVRAERPTASVEYRCNTQFVYDTAHGVIGMRSGCDLEGPCDDPADRDYWIPTAESPIRYVRLYFHVLCEDDGSDPVLSLAELTSWIDSTNSLFASSRIQFECEYEFVPSSQFRTIDDWTEVFLMREAYAHQPTSFCNIYAIVEAPDAPFVSHACFPWDTRALTKHGGIILSDYYHPPNDYRTLAHELGHCLGLYHTFHGVSEVTQCGSCYESPGAGNLDSVGDFCSDTPPTPVNYLCGDPLGFDPCTGLSWSPTDYSNLMSYAPPNCIDHFTGQQAGRMHCWLRDALMGWMMFAEIAADTTIGLVPLEINFTGIQEGQVDTWYWDFGDGTTDSSQNPVHTYYAPGLHDVSLTVTMNGEELWRVAEDFVCAVGDTLAFPTLSAGGGRSTAIDLYARNFLRVSEMTIPFNWGGPVELSFDSATLSGLRTEPAAALELIYYDPLYSRACCRLTMPEDEPLPPDTGAVVTIYFTSQGGQHRHLNMLVVDSFLQYEPLVSTPTRNYAPFLISGGFRLCLYGDVNGDGRGPNITDLTYLVAYLFGSGAAPPDMDVADIDRSGSVNIADLTYIVAYLFGAGSPPPDEC